MGAHVPPSTMSSTNCSWSANALTPYLYSTSPVKSAISTVKMPSPSASVKTLYPSAEHHPHQGPVTKTSVTSVVPLVIAPAAVAQLMSTLNVVVVGSVPPPLSPPPLSPPPEPSHASQLL